MNQDIQLKLQAYADGELSTSEASEVEALLQSDAEARDLIVELRNTQGALRIFEAQLKVPESRDFYWSKIRRQIEREEAVPAARPAIPWWRRILVPAGAFAGLAIAAMLAFQSVQPTTQPDSFLETSLADSGAVTYRDEAEGMTLVWLSYPAENEFAETDSEDTIQ